MPQGPRRDPACKISFAALGRVLGGARQPGLCSRGCRTSDSDTLAKHSLPPSLRAAAEGPLIQATLPPIIPRFRWMQAKIPFEAVVTRQLFWDYTQVRQTSVSVES